MFTRKRRKDIVKKLFLASVIISLLLYFSGVFSGLIASKIIRQQTSEDIESIEISIDEFRSNLENIQIQQNFFDIIENDECRFSKLAMEYMVEDLSYFWKKLPYRIEEFEEKEEYAGIKKQYTFLALKAWAIATKNYKSCETNLIPILYFYSKNCPLCIEQGKVLDRLKIEMYATGKEIIAFAIDIDLNETSVKLIQEYYGIENAPAMIIDGKVLKGRLHGENEIKEII